MPKQFGPLQIGPLRGGFGRRDEEYMAELAARRKLEEQAKQLELENKIKQFRLDLAQGTINTGPTEIRGPGRGLPSDITQDGGVFRNMPPQQAQQMPPALQPQGQALPPQLAGVQMPQGQINTRPQGLLERGLEAYQSGQKVAGPIGGALTLGAAGAGEAVRGMKRFGGILGEAFSGAKQAAGQAFAGPSQSTPIPTGVGMSPEAPQPEQPIFTGPQDQMPQQEDAGLQQALQQSLIFDDPAIYVQALKAQADMQLEAFQQTNRLDVETLRGEVELMKSKMNTGAMQFGSFLDFIKSPQIIQLRESWMRQPTTGSRVALAALQELAEEQGISVPGPEGMEGITITQIK